MITLKRNENIEIHQVELTLKEKTKQSPFISILILAQEQGKISAETLQQNLLASLPVRACENLLKRLEQQEYLLETQTSYSATYSLTELGVQSANDKSFWIGEKGVYNVYFSKSSFIKQKIIKIEKVERPENDKKNEIINTPKEIKQYEKQVLNINKTDVLIEDIEKKSFQIKPLVCVLEIQTKGDEGILKITNNEQTLFTKDIEVGKAVLQEELLTSCNEFQYNQDEKAILTIFNKDNLSFSRKVKISKPIFKDIIFNSIELENISHIPADKENAELWYAELLYKNLNKYFLDENSFREYALELVKPIQIYYNLSIPRRDEFAKQLSEKKDTFYQIAKLQTIDYLNY